MTPSLQKPGFGYTLGSGHPGRAGTAFAPLDPRLRGGDDTTVRHDSTFGNLRNVVLDLECLGPGGSVLGGGDVIAVEIKQVADLTLGGKEALRGAG
jgi:hypothetical protein